MDALFLLRLAASPEVSEGETATLAGSDLSRTGSIMTRATSDATLDEAGDR